MSYFKSSDDAQIYYTEAGLGKTVLLIGGWTLTTVWWKKQIEVLSKRYRVIAMDPRSYGASEKVPHGHRMSRHAADIHELLVHLKISDVTVVGWSLAANVLFSYWELFRAARISRFVHVDQTPFCLNQGDWQLGLQGFGGATAAIEFCQAFKKDREAMTQKIVDDWFVSLPSATEKEWMVEEILKTPIEAAIAIVWDHLNADWRDVVPTVQLPVLVATGLQSKIFPWQSGVWLSQNLPNSRHVIFDKSGHCPFWEEAEKFNDELSLFVEAGCS